MTLDTLRPRGPLIQLAVVAVCALVVVVWAQGPAAGLYGYDGHFHIKYSELLRERLLDGDGLIREFPWWQESFLKDHFADKDLLYHLLLTPFASGDLDRAGKHASIVFAVALYAALFVGLAWLRAPAPAGWTLALLVSSTTLLYRAGLLRSHVMAIAVAILGCAAILRERRLPAALFSAVYALTHIAWHLLPGIALLYDLFGSVRERRLRFGLTLACGSGTAAAVLLSPYFPENLRLWWVQNVEVLSMAWSPGAPDLGLGLEFFPADPGLLLYYNLGPALFTLAGIVLLVSQVDRSRRRRCDPAAVTLGLLTLCFLAMSLMSRRFVELWAPFSVLFAGLAAAGSPLWLRCAGRPVLRRSSLALFALLGVLNLYETRRIVGDDPGRLFDSCASWLRDNAPAGARVFTTDWDEFPELFFVAPAQRYLIGLDPTFMYVTDPARWRLWREVAEARTPDLHDPIAGTFGCSHLFADAGYERLIERADQDPSFRLETRSPDCAVYSLSGIVPARSMLHVPSWRIDGGDAVAAGPHDFVDVERLRGPAPPGAASQEECAQLDGALESPTAGRVSFDLATDDHTRVWINGEMVHDSTAAPPPTIDEVIALREQRRGIHQRLFGATLRAGYNDIRVSTCRTGRIWGFHLSGSTEP